MVLPTAETETATDLFDPGLVLGDGPHGCIVRAAVVPASLRSQFGASSVAVKIIPVGVRATARLQSAVSALASSPRHPGLARYHGVWAGGGGEAWVVSELCECGSIADVLAHAELRAPPEVERVLAYVVRNILLALDDLHAGGDVHGDVRVGNVLVDGNGRVKLADYGVYHILEDALRGRVSYPGARLWPAPEVAGRQGGAGYGAASEIWALGIALLELVDGRAAVMRSHFSASKRGGAESSGNGAAAGMMARPCHPVLRDPGRWSKELSDFIASACAYSPDRRPSAGELLGSGFVALADGRGLADALETAAMTPMPGRLQTPYDQSDVVQTLYRRNECVRAPLVDLDRLDASDFVDPEHHQGRNASEEKPAVEMALRTALRNRTRDAAVGLKAGSRDDGERQRVLETGESLSCLLETIDLFSARRIRGE